MKKQFLSVLAFSAILLSSCGGTAKIEKASACGQEGEITASSATAIAETESGKVAGAALDVFEQEPYRGPLLEFGNTILTSHVGSLARESRQRMEIEAADNLLQGLIQTGLINHG